MNDVADWWATKIIRMEPGQIEFRGQPIEELIKSHNFTQMIWLMVMGKNHPPRRPDFLTRRWSPLSIMDRKHPLSCSEQNGYHLWGRN